jgi:hypothetical protein
MIFAVADAVVPLHDQRSLRGAVAANDPTAPCRSDSSVAASEPIAYRGAQ